MSEHVFSIDFGTTYSRIAYVNETGYPIMVDNLEGTEATPSVVKFESPSEVIVGQIAKESAVIDPQNTVAFVKTLLGKSNFAINYNGEDFSPEEITALIFLKLAKDASNLLDTEVKDIVVTCPMFYGVVERAAIRNAGALAGLNVIDIISETFAAVTYYVHSKDQSEKNILVYELGGGLFNVSVIKINKSEISVICSDGSDNLGGINWDNKIAEYLASEFRSKTGYDESFDEYEQQELNQKAEKAKKRLSNSDKVSVEISAGGLKTRIDLSRTIFEKISRPLLEQTLIKTDSVLERAKSYGISVDEIILVGGAIRTCQITDTIAERYGTFTLLDFGAVARGAAIYANREYGIVVE